MKGVPEQCLGADLRSDRLPHHPRFEIDGPVAQRPAVAIRLRHEPQADAGCFFGDPGDKAGPEVLDEAIAGPQREGSGELLQIEPLGRAEHRLGFRDESTSAFAQLDRPRRRDQTPAGPDQQRIARRRAQPRQRPAHRRGAETKPLRGAGDAALGEQHVQRDEKVQVGARHPGEHSTSRPS